MAVVKWARCEQHERGQPCNRSAEPPPGAPCCDKANDADGRTDKASRFEQAERQNLCSQRRGHVESAAVLVEIDKRKRSLIRKARRVECEQQVAVFGMGIVVPSQSVIAKRQCRD